jgi:N-acetylneuraminate synthase
MADFLSQIENIVSTYSTDTIIILGKGPSVDDIRPEAFSSSLVIGLNDAERIAPVDITVFYADWVKQSIIDAGCRSRMYITSTDFKAPGRSVVQAPHYPLSQETGDLVMQRFLNEDLGIEDILFLSALKLARMVAQFRGRPQTVYMVGFDFDANIGYSHQIGHDYAPHQTDERQARISLQEFYFLHALYFLQNSPLTVKHIGQRAFSAMTGDAFNELILGPAAHRERRKSLVSVVAELTTNHFGDRNRLERMIRVAAAAGADYVKLQKRDVESFYTAEQLRSPYVSPFGSTFADYRHALELSAEDFQFVDELCRSLGIGWFASILDQKSFKFMLQFSPTKVKLPSTISEHLDYLSFVADNYFGDIVISTGMTDLAYEAWILQTFTRQGKLYLMQANSAYPTPLSDCNIGVVRHYDLLARENARIVPAFSSHDFGWKASAMAVAAGARMVEKHVKLGNSQWAHFDAVAVDLTTPDFKEYVDSVREAELIVGSEQKQVNASEHHKYFRAARA